MCLRFLCRYGDVLILCGGEFLVVDEQNDEGFGVDLLFQALRPSTIGAMRFHDRVRDGAGCYQHAIETKPLMILFKTIYNVC